MLEPIRKVVESEESVVIPCEAPDSLVEGCQCGSLNIAALPIAVACVSHRYRSHSSPDYDRLYILLRWASHSEREKFANAING
jgi:hypothetical protein